MANMHLLAIKMNGGYQPILIAANIEHNQIPHLISRWKNLAQGVKTLELICSDQMKPTIQRRFTIGGNVEQIL